ncbi:MAG: molecular chaperone TorD family protein [Magnetococcales bacterium]|nr:molecular chaperone TorD family protein [Magnetococcales bacterium]
MTTGADSLELLLRCAVLFRLIAQGFAWPYPSHRQVLLQQLEAIPLEHLAPDIGTAAAQLRQAWSCYDDERLQLDHSRLFHGQAAIALHETAYGDGRRMGGQPVEMADINGFYRAFGFDLATEQRERPDYLGTELEFYSLLLVKQAYAMDQVWLEQEQVTAKASHDFLAQHLGRWVASLVEEIRQKESSPDAPATPYQALSTLLMVAVTVECRRRSVTPVPFTGRLPLDETMQGDTLICPRDGHDHGESKQ